MTLFIKSFRVLRRRERGGHNEEEVKGEEDEEDSDRRIIAMPWLILPRRKASRVKGYRDVTEIN